MVSLVVAVVVAMVAVVVVVIGNTCTADQILSIAQVHVLLLR